MGTPLTTEYLDKILSKKLDDFEKKLESNFDAKFTLLLERTNLLEAKINDLGQKMNLRFSLVEVELEDIRKDLKSYAKRDKEDSDAFSKDVIKLQKRVSNLEEQVKKLKAHQKQSAKA